MYRNGEVVRNKQTQIALKIVDSFLEKGIVMYHYSLEKVDALTGEPKTGEYETYIGTKTQSDVIRFGAQLKISEIKHEK